MKEHQRKGPMSTAVSGFAIALTAIALGTGSLWSQSAVPARAGLALAPSSTIRLEGGSNVHDWSSVTTELRVTGSIDGVQAIDSPGALWNAVRAGQPVQAELRIPVKGFKSGKNKLDANMQKALRAETNPEIVYVLEKYQAKAESDSVLVTLTGRLTVAGKEQPLTMHVAVRQDAAGLRMKGQVLLKMTQFDVKPPTMMLGALRTHDDVDVNVDVIVKPASGGPQ